MERVAAIVLAGGQGRRMGGADKALLPLAGRPLLAHVLARIAPQCPVLAISANGDPARFAAFGLPVRPDSVEGFPGPLAGILAGLEAAAAAPPPFELVLSIPADAPFLPEDLVVRLIAARRVERAEIAMAASGGRRHPVVALWPVGLCDTLLAALTAGEHKVEAFAAHHRLAVVEWAIAPIDPFLNINTPADLAAAEAMFGDGL